MIQILGIRTYAEYGRVKPFVTLEKNKWRAPDVPTLLLNYREYLSSIPEQERFNLMFTLSHCDEGSGRTFQSQNIYPFDIDGIDVTRCEEYLDAVLPVLKITREQCTVVLTGHGLHIYIQGKEFEDVNYFKTARPLYKVLCDSCNKAMAEKWLIGSMDTDMWSPGRMGRVPDTINRKDYKDLPDVMVSLLYNNIKPTKFSLEEIVKLEAINQEEQISTKAMTRMPPPDKASVLEGCAFLQYCKENQAKVLEPQWYAMLSILGRLEDADLPHEYSKEHPAYRPEDTELKLQQAILTSGPRTCENINALWDGCSNCPNYGKVRSPILIKNDKYIATETTGFRKIVINKDGLATPKDISYDDLMAFYNREHPHITIAETGEIYTFKETHWVLTSRLELQSFAEANVNPKPKGAEREEFVKKMQANNLKPLSFLDCSGLMNLKNGVFDLETKELMPHSPEYGFRTLIPYDYRPEATCPRFDKFMEEITVSDRDIENLILEYIGYCLSSTPPEYGEKAMILLGEGANGKSVLIDVVRKLAGEGSTAAITMADLGSETQRYQLVGKLINVSEETPSKSIMESAMFKNVITGGTMVVKQLYHQPYSVKNECKLLFACNDMPAATDTSHGLFRRLLIVPFNAKFSGQKADKNLRSVLFGELSGILNRVIEGYLRLKENNWHFTIAQAVVEEAKDFEEATSPLNRWFSDSLQVDKYGIADGGTTLVELYKAYRFDTENTLGMRAVVSIDVFRKQIKRFITTTSNHSWSSRFIYRTGTIRNVYLLNTIPSGGSNGADF